MIDKKSIIGALIGMIIAIHFLFFRVGGSKRTKMLLDKALVGLAYSTAVPIYLICLFIISLIATLGFLASIENIDGDFAKLETVSWIISVSTAISLLSGLVSYINLNFDFTKLIVILSTPVFVLDYISGSMVNFYFSNKHSNGYVTTLTITAFTLSNILILIIFVFTTYTTVKRRSEKRNVQRWLI